MLQIQSQVSTTQSSSLSLMATLSHFPTFFFFFSSSSSSSSSSSLSPQKLSLSHSPFPNLHHLCDEPSPRKHFAIACASSIKKSRTSRKLMSDADLCNDLREFLSVVGLPEDHVPSMKELSEHGRKDLAHIVRRRGYKRIRELLTTSMETEIDESDKERNLVGVRDAITDCEDEITGQDEKVGNLDEHVSLSTEDPSMDISVGSMNLDPAMNADEQSCMHLESSTDSSFQEKVTKFIQNGELDTFEDDGYGVLNESDAEVGIDNFELENEVETESKTLIEEHPTDMTTGSNADASLNGSILISEKLASPAKDSSLFSNHESHHFHVRRDASLSTEQQITADYDKVLDVETSERENQVEINHLKFMLHQKELELSRLKERIEKEKLALSTLQSKAESEISKAQKLISEKDEELQAAEESLLGLEEVQIQYRGDGEIVEVAGSFNGWHHNIKMDPQPSSSIVDPIRSRKPRLWSTLLWLYPGVYEIKFIVDGEWKIDPQRESVARGTILNNILLVDNR